MDDDKFENITNLLGEARAGDAASRETLARKLYAEMSKIATGLIRRGPAGPDVERSWLVNEAMVRLLNGKVLTEAPNHRYLIAASAQAMRQVLIDYVRREHAAKRDAGGRRVPLEGADPATRDASLEVAAVSEAIDRLFQINERQAMVISLRFFAGLSVAEVSTALEVSVGTVEADWRAARAWMRERLSD